MSYFPEWGTSNGLVFTPCGPGTNRLCVISTAGNADDARAFLRLWKKEMQHRVVFWDFFRFRNSFISFEEFPWLRDAVGVPHLVSFSLDQRATHVTLDSSGNFSMERDGVSRNVETDFPGYSQYCKMFWILRYAPSEWDALIFGLFAADFLPDLLHMVQHAMAQSSRRGHTVLAMAGKSSELKKSILSSIPGCLFRELCSILAFDAQLPKRYLCLLNPDDADHSRSRMLQFVEDRISSVLGEVASGLSLTPRRRKSIHRYLSGSFVRISIARQMASAEDDEEVTLIRFVARIAVDSSETVPQFSLGHVLSLPPDSSASFGLHLVVEQAVSEVDHDVFVRSFDYIVDGSAVLSGITVPHRISLINSLSDKDVHAQLACLLLSKLPPTSEAPKIPSKTTILSWDFGTVSAKLPRRRVLFVGETRAGKTSTIQLLRGVGKQCFCRTEAGTNVADQQSTEVGGVHMMEIAVGVDGRSWSYDASERGAAAGAVSLFLRSAAKAHSFTVSQSHLVPPSSSLSAIGPGSEDAIIPDAAEGSADDSQLVSGIQESATPLASNGGIDDALAEIRNAASHIQSSCVSVFDFAGQDLYRCLDPLFFAPSSMYILVFDLLNLCDNADISMELLASEIDRCILSWLRRISGMLANAGSQLSQRSVVVLVGTRGSQFETHVFASLVREAVSTSINDCQESFANLDVHIGVTNPNRARGDPDVHPHRPFYVLENNPHLEGGNAYDDDRLTFMKSFSAFILRQFGDFVSASRPVPLRYLFLEAFVLQRSEWSARSVLSEPEILSYVVPALNLGSEAEARDALGALIESGSFFGFCSGSGLNRSEGIPETSTVIVIRPMEFVRRCAALISHQFLRSSANGYLQPNSSLYNALWQRIGAIQEDEVRRILCVGPVSNDGLCDEEKNCLFSTLCMMGILIPIRVVQMHFKSHPSYFLFTPRLHILRRENVVRDHLLDAAHVSTQFRSCSLAVQIQTLRGSEVPSVPSVSLHVFYRFCSFLHVAVRLTARVSCIGNTLDPLVAGFPIAEREMELVDDSGHHRVRIAIMPGGACGPFFAVRLRRRGEAAPLDMIALFKKFVSTDTGIPAGSEVVFGHSIHLGRENQLLDFVVGENSSFVPSAQESVFQQRMKQFDEYKKFEPNAAATSCSDAGPKEWTRQQLYDAVQKNLDPFLKYFFGHFDSVFKAVVHALNSFESGTADNVLAMVDRKNAVKVWTNDILLNPMLVKSQVSESPVQEFCAFLRGHPEVLREVADILKLPVFP
eukprot:ANDGO_07277.mRNA.1 hypothetical protein